jgi:aryl-alcohol dehydrogenase-like predicted oxidoreductase
VIGGLTAYAELVRSCTEDSIRRIGCGYLDLLVVEWTDAIVPAAETMAVFEAIIAAGELRYVVPANFPGARVLEILGATRRESRVVAGVQLDYSLAARLAFESGMAKLSADHGLGVVARAPLAGGHLASRLLSSGLGALRNRDARDRHAAVAAQGMWPMLSAIARARNWSRAQVALSWVLAHPQITSVLVSVSTVDQLRELLAATQLHLADEDVARLGRAPVRRSSSVFTS